MKASDYVAQFLKGKTDHVFGVQGGAVVHLLDSCERMGPRPIYCHHEQAAAFATSGYARIRGFGACISTTGPAATNTLSGVLGCYQDSIPVLFISGQQRSNLLSYGRRVRQSSSQEAPILNIVRRITKAARLCDSPYSLKATLHDLYHASISGRPGPVWLDLCQDVAWSELPNT